VYDTPVQLKPFDATSFNNMANHNYQVMDILTYMETPDQPDIFNQLYPEHPCYENAFSAATMTSIKNTLVQRGFLLPIEVRTGGGYDDVPFPPRQALRGNQAAYTQLGLTNQFRLSQDIGGDAALGEIQAYYQEKADAGHEWPGAMPVTLNACNINMANFMWRYTHKIGAVFRKIPASVEISHHAEGYSAAHPEWGACKVEIAQLENHHVNESRKLCTIFGLMWKKPSGEWIEQNEVYGGPTQCPHATCNSPCYAPYPITFKEPTGATPNPRKHGKGGRGGGRAKRRATQAFQS
jgi:hypothetical protein